MKNIDLKSNSRRDFLNKSGSLLAFGLTPVGLVAAAKISDKNQNRNDQESSVLDLSELPNFCSHEHWGSISSIGFEPSLGFRKIHWINILRGHSPTVRVLSKRRAVVVFGGECSFP